MQGLLRAALCRRKILLSQQPLRELRSGRRKQEQLLVRRLLRRRLQQRKASGNVRLAEHGLCPRQALRRLVGRLVREEPARRHAERRGEIFQRLHAWRGEVVFDLREHIACDAVPRGLPLRQPRADARLVQLLSQRHFAPSM